MLGGSREKVKLFFSCPMELSLLENLILLEPSTVSYRVDGSVLCKIGRELHRLLISHCIRIFRKFIH